MEDAAMSTLTIRNLDPEVKHQLRKLAAERGVSMEQEARDRLATSVGVVKRRKPSVEEILALGRKPDKPFDLKKVTDEMWDEGLL
jgi:plasmid stability protein